MWCMLGSTISLFTKKKKLFLWDPSSIECFWNILDNKTMREYLQKKSFYRLFFFERHLCSPINYYTYFFWHTQPMYEFLYCFWTSLYLKNISHYNWSRSFFFYACSIMREYIFFLFVDYVNKKENSDGTKYRKGMEI